MTNTAYTPGNFQRQVYYQQAPGVEGDFCDHNPRTSVDAGPGGLVAHHEGVTIARFAWLEHSLLDPNNAPTIVRSRSTGGPPAGFIHREQQGLITHYLGQYGMIIPGGFMVTLHDEGGFFVLNRGSNYAQLGMKAFARGSDGAVLFGPAGSSPAGAAFTGSVAASTFDVAGSITGNVLTVESVGTGPVTPGATIACAAFPPELGVKVVERDRRRSRRQRPLLAQRAGIVGPERHRHPRHIRHPVGHGGRSRQCRAYWCRHHVGRSRCRGPDCGQWLHHGRGRPR